MASFMVSTGQLNLKAGGNNNDLSYEQIERRRKQLRKKNRLLHKRYRKQQS